MKSIIKQDKLLLKTFLENSIPNYIKFQEENELDLMNLYEELSNYSQALLDGHEIDLNNNSYGTGKGFVLNQEYRSVLLELSNSNCEVDLKIHCYLSLITLLILQKYTDKK